MHAVLISGSRNPNGQTARALGAVQQGLETAGATTVTVFLPEVAVERCRQCEDNGWGLCRRKGACIIEDDMAGIVDRMRDADAVVMATPVYYGDLSESLRAFTDRLRRICTQEPGRAGVAGTPLVGVCVAGGGGGGAPSCCVSLEKVTRTCGFDVVDLVPVRRQNLDVKLTMLEHVGQWLATKPTSR